ncbi:MAG TPA: NmrA family NAD(P)-binding protein [Kofleriaceae bacterium]
MYLVTGITGHVGGAAARQLLRDGKQVRALVRDPDKAKAWAEQGVELVAGDLTDRAALERAVAGIEGVFVLVPPQNTAPDPIGRSREIIAAYAPVVSTVPNIVVLSSHGADQPSGTGFIIVTHYLEQALPNATMIRAGSFFENYSYAVGAAKATGVFDTFLAPLDKQFPFIASEDIGKEVAKWLQQPPAHRVIELGTMTTPNQVAEALAKAIGKPVTARVTPRESWEAVLGAQHLPPHAVKLFCEMEDAINEGRIHLGHAGAIRVEGSLTLEQYFKTL